MFVRGILSRLAYTCLMCGLVVFPVGHRKDGRVDMQVVEQTRVACLTLAAGVELTILRFTVSSTCAAVPRSPGAVRMRWKNGAALGLLRHRRSPTAFSSSQLTITIIGYRQVSGIPVPTEALSVHVECSRNVRRGCWLHCGVPECPSSQRCSGVDHAVTPSSVVTLARSWLGRGCGCVLICCVVSFVDRSCHLLKSMCTVPSVHDH